MYRRLRFGDFSKVDNIGVYNPMKRKAGEQVTQIYRPVVLLNIINNDSITYAIIFYYTIYIAFYTVRLYYIL